jgi:tetratricopeptide (TPR) repeat protein
VRDIVCDTLRNIDFVELTSDLKGFGQSRFYLVTSKTDPIPRATRNENRLGFYLSTIDALSNGEDWEAVLNTCRQALLDFPGNPEFIFHLAYAGLILERNAEAIASFEECVRAGYEVGDALHFIGAAYRALGDEARAVEHFQKCLQAVPAYFHAMVEMGEICFEHKEYHQAWKWAKRAARRAPRFFYPRALEIAIALILGKNIDLRPLVERVPDHNRSVFRLCIEDYLEIAGKAKHRRQLDLVFRSVYGSTGRAAVDRKDTLLDGA